MTQRRPSAPMRDARDALLAAGVRPTRQRIALAELALGRGDRHLCAEDLHAEALAADVGVSLATVYNTLKQFTEAGLLREIHVDSARVLYDTRTDNHPHFVWEDTGEIIDAPSGSVRFSTLPDAPEGAVIAEVDVLIRLRRAR